MIETRDEHDGWNEYFSVYLHDVFTSEEFEGCITQSYLISLILCRGLNFLVFPSL